MLEKINETVSVELISDSLKKKVYPRLLKWRDRIYKINKIGLHHTVKAGRTLFHVFSATDGQTFFRLKLDTETLNWKLEEVADGF